MATLATSALDSFDEGKNATDVTQRGIAFLGCTLLGFFGLIIVIADAAKVQFGPVVASFAMVALWLGIGIAVLAQCIAVFTPGRWKPELRALWIILAILIASITLPLFELFKQHILPARGFPFDPYLAALDRILFLGNDPWRITHALFGNLAPTMLIDTAYALWMPMMFAYPMVAVMATRDEVLRIRLLGTWLWSWVLIAGLGAWLFASAGPCYYNALVGPDAGFMALNDRLNALSVDAHVHGKSITALDFQALLLSGQHSQGLLPAGGISAMPSMHVAMAVLFAISGFRIARALGWIMSGYALLIWIGSIHLGWHYASDGIAGAAMMIALWKAVGWLLTSSQNMPSQFALPPLPDSR